MKLESLQIPDNWRQLTLGECCTSVQVVTPNQHHFSTFHYIDISSIDRDRKLILHTDELSYEDAPSRARQVVKTNDVLVSTVRPGLNAVALVPEDLHESICSTGFCVLRVQESVLDYEFLFAWVRSPLFIQSLTRLERGIGYPAVSDSDVKNTFIPLPPPSEQRRIVDILREADRLRQLRHEADEKAKQLLQAQFYEMFGDPVNNPKAWNVVKLDDVCDHITDGTHQPPPFTEEGIPFLFVSNIVGGKIDLNTDKHISQETYELLMKRSPVEQGDILYSTVGSYGIAVVVEDNSPFAFQRHMAHIKPNRSVLDTYFLRSMLNSVYVKSQADQRVRGIAQGTLNLGELAEFLIYLPPLTLQQAFAEKVKVYQEVNKQQKTGSQSLDTLFQSLLSRAFTGKLTAAWRVQHADLVQEGERQVTTGSLVAGVEHLESLLVDEDEEAYEEEEQLRDRESLRAELIRRLSEEQWTLLTYIQQHDGYCTPETLQTELEEQLPVYAIYQGLQLLTQVGLLQSVSLPDRPVREIVYIPAYRKLFVGDYAKETDLALLQEKLEQEMLR